MAELVILTRGYAVLTIDDIRYRLSPGDAAIVFPLVPHSYDEVSEDVSGITAIFSRISHSEYTGTFPGCCQRSPSVRRSAPAWTCACRWTGSAA